MNIATKDVKTGELHTFDICDDCRHWVNRRVPVSKCDCGCHPSAGEV